MYCWGHRVLMTQVFVLQGPGATKARKSHAKFHANEQAEKFSVLENCENEWKTRQKKNLERLRQWLAWLLRKFCPRVTGARKESKMVGCLHVFLFSCRWSQIFLVLLTYLILFIVFEQLRRQARLRREYLYRKSVEEKERSTYERKKKLKIALEGQFLI